MTDDRAAFPPDHNAVPMRVEALARIALELTPYAQRRDELVASANKFTVIRDRIDAAKATDIIGIGKAVGDLVDAERRKITDPHYDTFRSVNDHVANFWSPAAEAIAGLVAKMDTFADEEDARIKRQEDETRAHEDEIRRQREAPAAAAPAAPQAIPARPRAPAPSPAKRRPVRGDYGFSAHANDVDVIEIVDVHQIPDMVLLSDPVIAAITAAVRPMVAKGMRVPGLKVTKAKRTTVKR